MSVLRLVAVRVLAVVASGALGPLRRVEGTFTATIGRPDIRWDNTTGGGSLSSGCTTRHASSTVS